MRSGERRIKMEKKMLRHSFALGWLIIFLTLLAGCRSTATPSANQPPSFLFDYDQQAPLAVFEKAVDGQDWAILHVHDLSYAVLDGQRVKAYLVKPVGAGPFPGLLILHGAGSDRDQFLNRARLLAKKGMVSLLVTANFDPRGKTEDREKFIQFIVKLRRAVDLLAARPEVDPNRLGFIGFGNGADAGAVLAGVDMRLKAYVLMSGRARISTWTSLYAPEESRERYRDLMASIDPINYIGQAAPAAIFFQNGRHEGSIPEQEARALQRAGSEPKQVQWYDSYEVLPGQAHDDAAEWLHQQLDDN
jgi:dienelactone hydrolase